MSVQSLLVVIIILLAFVGYALHRGNVFKKKELSLREAQAARQRLDKLLEANFPHLLPIISPDYWSDLADWVHECLAVENIGSNFDPEIMPEHPFVDRYLYFSVVDPPNFDPHIYGTSDHPPCCGK